MPCTFSHPLAVIPLRRFCPAWLNLPALAIGSMSPDFGYYVRQFPLAVHAHTIAGTFAVCLPSGLIALASFYLLRRPLCFMLPEPHRSALTPLARKDVLLSPRTFASAVGSILLGAWTHMIWDSFTHKGAWAVQHISALRTPLIHLGGTTFQASYVLQQASTFVGGGALVLIYILWLCRQRKGRAAEAVPDFLSDRARYLLFALVASVALALALPAAMRLAAYCEGFTAFRVLVFHTGVYAAAVFFPLFTVTAVIFYFLRRKAAGE